MVERQFQFINSQHGRVNPEFIERESAILTERIFVESEAPFGPRGGGAMVRRNKAVKTPNPPNSV
jgi:hypothetical protein